MQTQRSKNLKLVELEQQARELRGMLRDAAIWRSHGSADEATYMSIDTTTFLTDRLKQLVIEQAELNLVVRER